MWTKIRVANRTSTAGWVIDVKSDCTRRHAASCRHCRSTSALCRGISALALTVALPLMLAPATARDLPDTPVAKHRHLQRDSDTPAVRRKQPQHETLAPGAKPKYKAALNETERKEKERTSKEPFGPMPNGPLQIVVSIEQQRLHLYSDGTHVADAIIATGVPQHPTPMGVFSVLEKDRFHHSNIYSGAPMPFMQRITWSGVALHEGANLGHPASHGCIRMPGEFAARLFLLHSIGARVVISRPELHPEDFTDPHLFVRKDKTPASAPAPSAALPMPIEPIKTAQTIDASKTTDAIPAVSASVAPTAATKPDATEETSPVAAAAADGATALRLNRVEEEPAKSLDGKNGEAATAAGDADPPPAADEAKPNSSAADNVAAPTALPAPAASGAGATEEAAPTPAAAAADAKPDAAESSNAVEATAAAAAEAKPAGEGPNGAVEAPAATASAPATGAGVTSADPPPAAKEPATAAIKAPANASANIASAAEAPTPASALVPTPNPVAATDAALANAAPVVEPPPLTVIPEAVPLPAPKPAAIANAAPPKKTPITIFVSRKAKRLYVRQNFAPLFDAAVTIDDPTRALGTHVFTALNTLPDGAMRWNVISLPADPPRVERETEKKFERDGKGKRTREAVVVLKPAAEPASTPQEALARIEIPQDVIDQIADMIVPGSSLIVSDQGLGEETGEGTDFIVVTR